MVCKLHGFPRSLISDQDPFLSTLLAKLLKLSGTKLHKVQPITFRLMARLGYLIECLSYIFGLMSMVNLLSGSNFSALQNGAITTPHILLQGSPLSKPLFGKSPPTISIYFPGSFHIEVVDSLLSSQEDLLASLTCKLHKAQQTIKAYVDSHCHRVSYKSGDWV